MSYILPFALTLAVCFGLQSLALRAVGGRTAKSESNFFSSIGRIQAGAFFNADAMVLGSSITGRLPDRAQGFTGWANMGCDGGCAVDALRAMDAGILPNAAILVLEANTLHMALNREQTEIGAAMRRPWFRIGLQVPNLAAYARPSAFFYSKLLEKRIGGFESGSGEDLKATGAPILIRSIHISAMSSSEKLLVDEIVAILDQLERRGSKSFVVWLPPARSDASSPPSWILELARRSEAPYWDLGQQAAEGTVVLTDGVHMAAPSAMRTMSSLANEIR